LSIDWSSSSSIGGGETDRAVIGLGKSSDGEGLETSWDVESSGGSSARDGDRDGCVSHWSVLPLDVELLVVKVEPGKDVPDTIGGSFVGSSGHHVSVWSSLSSGRDTSDLEVVVRSRVESSHSKGSVVGGFGVGSNIDPNSGSGVSSVGNVPLPGVGRVRPKQSDLVGGLIHNPETAGLSGSFSLWWSSGWGGSHQSSWRWGV